MREAEVLRARLAAAHIELPEELLEVVIMAAGPLITALDELLALDFQGTEPFAPAQRLVGDAA
jgi:hypothetical protein